MLRDGDRAAAQANLEAEIPNACEYFGLDSEPTVVLSVVHGNIVIRGVVTNGDGEEMVLVRYHLGSGHPAMYRTPT